MQDGAGAACTNLLLQGLQDGSRATCADIPGMQDGAGAADEDMLLSSVQNGSGAALS